MTVRLSKCNAKGKAAIPRMTMALHDREVNSHQTTNRV